VNNAINSAVFCFVTAVVVSKPQMIITLACHSAVRTSSTITNQSSGSIKAMTSSFESNYQLSRTPYNMKLVRVTISYSCQSEIE
jgi:hypothetical protein